MPGSGRLYVVAVPIGNYQDITLRALDILRRVDGVICEEYRAGSTLLKALGVENTLLTLNEHNERTEAAAIAAQIEEGKSYALISDAGTPVFADPGQYLISLLAAAGIEVVPAPGPSSLMAALSVCDFRMERFVYGGFLPRDPDQRRRSLRALWRTGLPVALMDAPYRLAALLEDVVAVYGPGQRVMLACDITLPGERIFRGAAADVLAQARERKSEFVLVIREAETRAPRPPRAPRPGPPPAALPRRRTRSR